MALPLLQALGTNALLVAVSPQRLPELVLAHCSEDAFIAAALLDGP